MLSASTTEVFRRVVEREIGSFSPELVRAVLNLDFPGEDHAQFETLSAKAQDGALTLVEAAELDGYLQLDSLPATWRLKAERSLHRNHSA